MPKRQVLIVHGWSDRSDSFRPLAKMLQAQGYEAVPLWLADYISKEDDVSIPDVAKRMEEVLLALVAEGTLAPPFDMVVHSTGGLVGRTWLTMFDCVRPQRWLERLVMLAPANYGSRLASIGKSMLGRLTKGLDNGLQTGTQMLNALELGSPYQWQLALADVLADGALPVPSPAIYADTGCLPFVITGIRGYQSILRKPLNEDGADGTVRAAAANLTSHGLTLDFRTATPVATPWSARSTLGTFAFRMLADQDHTSVTQGAGSVQSLVLQALACPMDSAGYLKLKNEWDTGNESLASEKDPTRHQFFQLNTFVVDDLGQPVADHFIEFSGSNPKTQDAALSVFQTDVIEHVHVNDINKACRTFYIDRTDLFGRFYKARAAGRPRDLVISISASPPGPNTAYFSSSVDGASGSYRVHLEDDTLEQDRWLRRHCTHFMKIIIPRRPREQVFRLTRYE